MKINNILIDSTFKNIDNRTWVLDNVSKYEVVKNNLKIESKERLYGIHQSFRAKKGRYYFRANVQLKKFAREIIIGYKREKELYMNYTTPFVSNNTVSTIFDIEEDIDIELYIIIKSNTESNKAIITEPILVNLDDIKRRTWLKSKLDKEIKYKKSLTFYNEIYKDQTKNNWGLEKPDNILINGNIDAVIFDKGIIRTKLNINTEDKYLIRIKYGSNNAYSKLKIRLNDKEHELETGKGITDKDIYFIGDKRELNIVIEFMNDEITPEIPAIFMIEQMMIINLTKHKLEDKKIEYLPYI